MQKPNDGGAYGVLAKVCFFNLFSFFFFFFSSLPCAPAL